MTGVFLPSVKTPGGAGSFRLWEKDRARVEQDIVAGLPFDAFVSERGRFDAMFDFMLRSGLWKAATEMRPSAESTLRTLDGYGLRRKSPARPALAPCIRFLSIDSHICYTLLSDPTSRRWPLRSR